MTPLPHTQAQGRGRQEVFYLAMHLRSYTATAEVALDDEPFQEAARGLLASGAGVRRPCAVLLASDKDPRLVRVLLGRLLKRWGYGRCEIVQSELEAESDGPAEHGNYTGVTALRDLDLLSRAHAFVAMNRNPAGWSTFSLVAGQLLAFARAPRAAPVMLCSCGNPWRISYAKPAPARDPLDPRANRTTSLANPVCPRATVCQELSNRTVFVHKGRVVNW